MPVDILEMEEWKKFPDNDLYEVSTFGNIKRDNIIRKINTKRKYLHLDLYDNTGIAKWYLIHRLVAMTFIANPENKPEVDHINKNTHDNRIENLRWVTSKENKVSATKSYNCPPPGITAEKYISLTKQNTYKVTIQKKSYQKRFKTLEDAVYARDKFLNTPDKVK